MTERLLPVGSSVLEVAAAQACADIENIPVPMRKLWNAYDCPLVLLPYLAWAWSVDRWDEGWSETTKRRVVASAQLIHRHKGTTGALRRVVEPMGLKLRIKEWWKTGEAPGTFRLDVSVLDNGITEEMYQELVRLIGDAKPVSRHMLGLNLTLDVNSDTRMSAACYDGDALVVYPYFPETITVSGVTSAGSGVHIIDTMRVNNVS